jgi:hypothetical protein
MPSGVYPRTDYHKQCILEAMKKVHQKISEGMRIAYENKTNEQKLETDRKRSEGGIEASKNRTKEKELERRRKLSEVRLGIPLGPRDGIAYKDPKNDPQYPVLQDTIWKWKESKCQEPNCLSTSSLNVHHLLPYEIFKKMYKQNMDIFYDPTLCTLYCSRHHRIEDTRLKRELRAWKLQYT